jgi:tryptophan-rich sensory protein
MQKIIRIALVVTVCLAIGFLSGMATQDGVKTWFPTLIKPIFNPPAYVFAPVWTILYIMIGIAGGLVWGELENNPVEVKKGFKLFIFQLALNALWSYLFFSLHNPLLAFVEIILLWLLIIETFRQFKIINKTAAYLFIPYLLWVSFAMVLNGSIWWLNR